MTGHVHTDLKADIAAAMAWWRDAGVDCAFVDEAQSWLPQADAAGAVPDAAEPPKPVTAMPVASPPVAKIGGDTASWPSELATFHKWWLEEPSLDLGRTTGRVAPRGPAQADVLVLVEQPEAGDSDSLLSGPQGKILAAMLRAFGLDLETAYFASVLPRAMPLPDWSALHAAGIGEVTLHHITLVAPKRILCFGSSIPSLLGNGLAQNGPSLTLLNHENLTIPLLGERGLEALARPSAKAGFWQRWLDWSRTKTA